MKTTTEICRRAREIAGCLWSDRQHIGTLADQLLAVAATPDAGTDGDLTDADRRELRALAAEIADARAEDIYAVRGSVRGLISRHRTIASALASCQRDKLDCWRLGGGAYSDAQVERIDGEQLSDGELREMERWYIAEAYPS